MLVYNDGRHDFDEAYLFPLPPPRRNMRPNKLRWTLPDGFEPINAAAYFRLWRGADPDWEAKLAEVLQRRDGAARELAATGWEPPVADAAAAGGAGGDPVSAEQRLIQGLRLQ